MTHDKDDPFKVPHRPARISGDELFKTSACRGCGVNCALLDGHFCSRCHNEIARVVRDGLTDSDVVDVDEIIQSFVHKDGHLQIEVDLND